MKVCKPCLKMSLFSPRFGRQIHYQKLTVISPQNFILLSSLHLCCYKVTSQSVLLLFILFFFYPYDCYKNLLFVFLCSAIMPHSTWV